MILDSGGEGDFEYVEGMRKTYVVPKSKTVTKTTPTRPMKFTLGERVRKIKGSAWQGFVVGTYRSSITREGYAVESEREKGSVQIYPAEALELAPPLQDNGTVEKCCDQCKGMGDCRGTTRDCECHRKEEKGDYCICGDWNFPHRHTGKNYPFKAAPTIKDIEELTGIYTFEEALPLITKKLAEITRAVNTLKNRI